MQRIATSTAAQDLFGAGKHGFKNGDPQTGEPSTQLNAAWFNSAQEEICAVIEGAGLALDPASYTQLREAIAAMIDAAAGQVGSATTDAAGVVELATAAEAQALADAARAITPATLDAAFQGGNQSLGAAGYQRLPGGLILQWGSLAVVNDTDATATLPIAFPITALGAFVAIVQPTPVNAGTYEQVTAISTTQITLRCNTDATVKWLALGY